ncbi:putative MATE family efflux protein [Flavobacterium sp. 7E]|uniref:MATE family efflux transporter n=1 Tax=unclassified Flavobacterium TaxID=196869 RepID=UPI00156F3706|nr:MULTISPECIES: MATE family efflux transporter [unclassified Flavobacterium]MBE0392125.1 Multidrug export protein MepA [Flavobacterium sp. PL002]NRS87965.1 putative MATE family efflux protein [Flavobacterium sp. 7E]NRT14526.1 putative MATE family efflux protein [Flavobacterium sp. 28A]
MAVSAEELGTQDIKKLLIKQAVPASVGILFMSVNILIDTIFVGQWIGSLAIAAVTVVLPITFFISSLGMAIGVGGGSVLSRALGANDKEKALFTFANQIMMTFLMASVFVLLGMFFSEDMLLLFGAKGAIVKPATEFFFPIILSVPFLALCMMGNNIIRAEGKAKFAMYAMIIPAFVNIILDVVFIKIMNLGMFGAALATSISYFMCFVFVFWFFRYKSELKLKSRHFKFHFPIIKEITTLSFVTFSRQGVISILSIILNHTLYTYGGEHSLAVYGIISRMLMFALFPVLGITQGFIPIAGYNYGSNNFERVKESIQISIKYAALLAAFIFVFILFFAKPIVAVFTTDPQVIAETPNALRWVFAASPIIAIQLIGAAYFQAAGKAKKALFLTLSKQGFFLIPLVLILPNFFGIFGVWVSFPIADVLSTMITAYFLKKEMNTKLTKHPDGSIL